MKAHESIYDCLYAKPNHWFDVKDMAAMSGFSESTVRRAFHHLDAAAMVDQRQLSGRTQYCLRFVPLPVVKKKSWFRRNKGK